MAYMQTRFDDNKLSQDILKEFGKKTLKKMELPTYIEKNISNRIKPRYYQKDAFNTFRLYMDEYPHKIKPVHLLFEMATGSGKTPEMHWLILELYKRGYRNFIYFVNSKTIIDKTKINFLDPNSEKYLPSSKTVIDGEEINIKEVETFTRNNDDNINIKFTTIQGLHYTLHNPKENDLTWQDFNDLDVVFISDEAHHLNALTKKRLTKEEEKEAVSWEKTIRKILYTNKENILLEFTATAELKKPEIGDKYKDKVLYEYNLKQFRNDGFSKDVDVLETDADKFTRTLQAIIVSQYRKKISEKNNVFVKPIILLKSKTIKESEDFYKDFKEKIKNISVEDLNRIESNAEKILKKAFEYLKNNNISKSNFIKELQLDFSEEKCIVINSKSQTEENQILINELEKKNNPIRMIFAVDMLNEGWDVLNLFDIVRLYETRSNVRKDGKIVPGPQTTKEAQLIGRGARGYPFKVTKDQDEQTRKYDYDIDNELRALEELHYHCKYSPQYITEIKQELERIGIRDTTEKKTIKLKPEFKKTKTYQSGIILLNKKIENKRKNVRSINDLITKKSMEISLETGLQKEVKIFEKENGKIKSFKKERIKLLDLGHNVLMQAMQKNNFYTFKNLKKYMPNISSKNDLIFKKEYLKDIEIDVVGTVKQMYSFTQEEKLEICKKFLKELEKEIKKNTTEYIGTKQFEAKQIKDIFKDEKRIEISSMLFNKQGYGIALSKEKEELRMDVNKKHWYVYQESYGTTPEKRFLNYFDMKISKLEKHYSNIYLIRNEQLFSIYSFNDGRTFQPDFVLMMEDRKTGKQITLQMFIEPKGEHLEKQDKWKEDFLLKLRKQAKPIYIDEEIKIIGLPFYNERNEKKFDREFKKILGIA